MTDKEIIRGCQRGRAKYQRELVLRYSAQLMTVARRYCRDNHAAKDVLQDAFIRVFKAINNYQDTGSFAAWLRRIVVNVALQKQDKASYQREAHILEEVTHPLVPAGALERLQVEELIALVQRLPDGFREVFNLYALEGYSHDEIADLLNIPPGTSRSKLTRARQKLQAMILNNEKVSYAKRVG